MSTDQQPIVAAEVAEPSTDAPAADEIMEEAAEEAEEEEQAEAEEAESEQVVEAEAVAEAEDGEDEKPPEEVLEIVAVTVVDENDDESVDAEVTAEAVIADEQDDDDDDDDASEGVASRKRKASDTEDSLASLTAPAVGGGGGKRAKGSKKKSAGTVHVESGAHKGERVPSLRQLGIPFRNTRRTMKLNVNPVTIVQNEAAIVATYAMELFLLKFSKNSLMNAKKKGRHTIRYEDLAEARMMDPTLNFLDYLIP